MTKEQHEALARQADAQRAAAATALEAANKAGLKGKAKLELIANAIQAAAKKSTGQTK